MWNSELIIFKGIKCKAKQGFYNQKATKSKDLGSSRIQISILIIRISCFIIIRIFFGSDHNRTASLIDTKDKKCSLPQKMTLDQKKAPSHYSAFYASKNRRIQQNQLSLFTALFLLLKLHQHSPVYNLILFHCPEGLDSAWAVGTF